MPNAKACVVFTVGLEAEVPPVLDQLASQGFDICTASADQETVEAAQAGSTGLPDAIKGCIDNAVVCVFLIPETVPESLIAAAGYAGSSGNRIVAVCEDVTALPKVFDELATSVVQVNSPKLPEAIQGDTVWEAPNGSAGAKRSITRIKCQ